MGSAEIQGRLWGERVRDYARIAEPMFRRVYERLFDETGVNPGTSLLDVGCGPGLAAQIAADRGARVAGLDAAETSLALARERTPGGDFRLGDMECLPWPNANFDVVTGFNAFQFAATPVNALREAKRVSRPGARVGIVVWGGEEDSETFVTMRAVSALLPPAPGANGLALFAPGRVETLLREAGLEPSMSGEVDCAFDFPDLETALLALTSVGLSVAAAQRAGMTAVRDAISATLMQFRTGDGCYIQRNRFRYIVALA